jgi:ribosomal protein L32
MSNMYVKCKECGEEHRPNEVEVTDCEEDFATGGDLLTYTCPVTGKETKSLVYRQR